MKTRTGFCAHLEVKSLAYMFIEMKIMPKKLWRKLKYCVYVENNFRVNLLIFRTI
jgi:hypothetical protein